MQPTPIYTCSTCRLGVLLIDGKTIRACKHDTAAILANMTATAHGAAKVSAK